MKWWGRKKKIEKIQLSSVLRVNWCYMLHVASIQYVNQCDAMGSIGWHVELRLCVMCSVGWQLESTLSVTSVWLPIDLYVVMCRLTRRKDVRPYVASFLCVNQCEIMHRLTSKIDATHGLVSIDVYNWCYFFVFF